jgi:hypothetical protein
VPKWCKTIIAILLLPVCAGAIPALWMVLRASGDADTLWVAFLSGAACWVTIYLLLPKPMWVYVFGHELTHVLWTWLLGGKVKKFKASATGGHVVVNKSNFVIALAPYFFPIYAALVVVVFLAGHCVVELASLPRLVPPAARRGLRLSCNAQLAHSQIQPNGHRRSGISLFSGDYLFGQCGGIIGGDPAAGVEGGDTHGAGLVAAMHQRDAASPGKDMVKSKVLIGA